MYNLLMKNGQVMAFGLGVACVLIFLFMMFGGTPDADNAGLTFGLMASMFFIFFCAIAAAGFAVYQNLGNVKGLIPSVLALLAVGAAIFKFIGFITQTTATVVEKSTDIGMMIGIGMLALATLIWIISLVMDFFKG